MCKATANMQPSSLRSNNLDCCFPIFPKVRENYMHDLKVKAIFQCQFHKIKTEHPCSRSDPPSTIRYPRKQRMPNGKFETCEKVSNTALLCCVRFILFIEELFLRSGIAESGTDYSLQLLSNQTGKCSLSHCWLKYFFQK